MATSTEAYRLGTAHSAMPAPLIPEQCREVAAGPIRLVVESRFLADDMATLNHSVTDTSAMQAYILDDGGGTVHVFGTADGLEHVRFDCFDKHPHYHYIRNRDHENLIVRFDEIALGDPIAWSAERLRTRLPEMLEFAGVPELADAVRADPGAIDAAVDTVVTWLSEAREREHARRASVTPA